jgi:uncharacterized membrane protein YsdA (DUF1294 family)
MRAALLAYAALNAVAFMAHGWDKRLARGGGRRIRASTLHALALAGGFAGAWLGMRFFRHKTRKPAFLLVVLAAAALHAAAWAWVRPRLA